MKLLGDLILKGNQYEINVYTFIPLATSKPRFPQVSGGIWKAQGLKLRGLGIWVVL